MRRSRSATGFTLIELMVTTAIIGILASVAVPSMRLMNYRAKTTERGAIIRGIRSSLNAVRVKDGTFGAGIAGDFNPALPLATNKRPFSVTAGDWDKLDLGIDGNLYYSYQFTAQETPAPFFVITVEGDVDGDNDEYLWPYHYDYDATTASFVQTSDSPSVLYEYTVF